MFHKKIHKLLAMAVMITGLLALAGCSARNTTQNQDTAAEVNQDGNAAESTADTEGENDLAESADTDGAGNSDGAGSNGAKEEWPRVVTTVMGEVEIPARPERVVANWYIGDVYSVGIKPVAGYGWLHETMSFYEDLKDMPLIENWDAETIMSYEPDVIVTYDQEDYNKFSKIAPVIVLSESDMTPEERTQFLGKALGREEEADSAVKNFEDRLAKGKEVLEGDKFTGKSFSILQDWGSGSYGIYYETGSRGGTLIYDYFGLKLPDKLQELIDKTGEGRGALSYEVAADYFGDYTIWFLQEDMESEYAKTEIFKSIPAVKEGRLIEIPGEMTGLFYYSDVLSLTAQVDYLVDKLNAAGK